MKYYEYNYVVQKMNIALKSICEKKFEKQERAVKGSVKVLWKNI